MKTHGNGSGKYAVHAEERGGWVRVFSDLSGALPDHFALALSQMLADWFRHRPQLRLRCIVPVCKEGNTIELHAWYDVHVMPPPPPPAPS